MAERNIKGLSEEQVARSRQEHGSNVVTQTKKESVWQLFFEKFNDPIIKILFVAAFLSLVVGFVEKEFAETIGIFCAIFLATGISFWFEYDAKRRFEILNVVNDDTPVKVIRDGSVMEIPKRDVVVGDIVVLSTGDEVPADGKLIEAVSMKVNESSLTGEPITFKTTDADKQSKESTYPSDYVLKGTSVVEGHGMMEVDAVGDATEYGKVSQQSTIESGEETPLNKQLNKLSSYIGKIGALLAISIFLILLTKGIFFSKELITHDWLGILNVLLKYFMVSVAIMVMAVPEGLPMSITLSLAMSMRRMLKTNNLVRKMHACETMGAVTVICTDKTGTLTRNIMTVSNMLMFSDIPQDDMAEMISVNSSAFLDKEHKVIGNPTEGALLTWLYDKGVNYEEIRNNATIIDQIPFSTELKYMATLVAVADGGSRILYVKGAPEIVMAMCSDNGQSSEIKDKLKEFQGKAFRTLAFAVKHTNANSCKEALEGHGLDLVAITSISDPVREDVPAAVKDCLDAGIDIKIVTGDTPTTAREIARQIGLWNDQTDGDKNEITGIDFEKMSDEELLEKISELKIMARARPLDKQRLVKLLQQKGEVVAVTGDGTNDAPALNFAQVGLSMGSGTSVAKQASDITLLDDSFASISTAVMWGRSLYKNIQRFVLFQLTVNFVAMVVVFFGSIFGGELPLTVTQILWVNLIMDTFAALALASLPPDPIVMKEKPRKQTDFIITRPIFKTIIGVGSVMIISLLTLLILWGQQATVYQLTIFFTCFVMFQFWNLFNAKTYGSSQHSALNFQGSMVFLLILLVIFIGQVLIVEFGGDVFRTESLSLRDWAAIVGGTSLIMFGGEAVRLFRKKSRVRQLHC